MKRAGIGPVLTLLASVFSAQAAGGALPDDEVGRPGGWRDVARPLVSSLKTLASEFSRNITEQVARARLKAEARALLFASGQRPIAAFLDMNHRTGDAERFLNNPDLVAGWKAQGKKSIFLEIDRGNQGLFDRFYGGQTTKEEFAREISAINLNMWLNPFLRRSVEKDFVEGIALLKATGISVYCVDSYKGIFRGPKDEKLGKAFALYVQGILSEEEVKRSYPGGVKGLRKDALELYERRLAQNKEIAAAIKKHLHEGEGAIIIYGGGHFSRANDFDEMLGKTRVITVAILRDNEFYNNADFGEDPPDYTLIRESGEFFLDRGGQRAGLPQFQPSDTRQPENPALPAVPALGR